MADLPVHHVAVAVDRAGVRRTARVRAAVDEVIVTTFTAGAQNALPLWIFGAIRLGRQLPEVNVVVLAVLIMTIVPVGISVRLTGRAGIR